MTAFIFRTIHNSVLSVYHTQTIDVYVIISVEELNVFVDLAMMSAGDEPINIMKVQCLHSAVRGYAPLIFKLDKSSGYKEMLQRFEHVFKELKANPKMPYQMVYLFYYFFGKTIATL